MLFKFIILLLYQFFSECWDGEPDNRPDMNQVVAKLKTMITQTTTLTNNYPTDEELSSNTVNNSSNINEDFLNEVSDFLNYFCYK